ncbi:MAG TPA: UDP-N-acetylmuramoyl-tripeptide--D-alanyl-D-alanine ligase [Candidatus Acidoferrales bacterium]|nr:UDP-N-acetylmuramoyl-tripeptide--D-alanyl-D-alanine ligase [Candidatus Acidoferrales bacterium]
MTLPFDVALAATGAVAYEREQFPAYVRFSTDTRSLQAGDVFVALRGERFDGHTFVREAQARGASGAIVEDAAALPDGFPGLVVAQTTRAYLDLAGAARLRLHARVAAITGSTGKTTTKSLLAQILGHASTRKSAATPANENNEIGVAKLFLSLDEDVAYVVVEFGARHYGEIAPLAQIAAPDVAVLTNIGDAHLEIMGSRERLAQTKFGIFSSGAQPILNAADAQSRSRAAGLATPPQWFDVLCVGGGDLPAPSHVTTAIVEDVDRAAISLVHTGEGAQRESVRLDLQLPGYHNRWNLAAAAAAAHALGFSLEAIAEAVPSLRLPAGRYERSRVGDVEIIFDAYNASMSGTLATLDSFVNEAAPRRIVVLASMAELGAEAPAMHARVGARVAGAQVDVLLVGGQYADDLARGAREAGFSNVVHFARNDDAVSWLAANARAGDLVLFKGSRMYRLEEIVEGLRLARA